MVINARNELYKSIVLFLETRIKVLGHFLTIDGKGALYAFLDINNGSKEIVYTLLGSFSTAFTMTINYFFGSSEGSKEKTKIIQGK